VSFIIIFVLLLYLFPVRRSLGGAIHADITANFPRPLPFSGLINLAGLPFLNQTTLPPTIESPFLVGLVQNILLPNDTTLALSGRVGLVNASSAKIDQIPFLTQSAWLGATALLTPTVGALVMGRQQDPTRLFEEGAGGFPFLVLFGKEDSALNGTAVIELYQGKNFTNLETRLFDDAGHVVFVDQEKETADILLNWIEKVAAGGKTKHLSPSSEL
jgi:pimeloyl-ACP methyl ester carboxylesterase